jgi:hypothetical protein
MKQLEAVRYITICALTAIVAMLTAPAVAQVRSVPVSVENDATAPIPVKVLPVYPRRPFAVTQQTIWNSFSIPGSVELNIAAPNDGTLVIESVSLVVGLVGSNQLLRGVMTTVTGGTSVLHFWPMHTDVGQLPVGGDALYEEQLSLRAYADAGSTLKFRLDSNGDNGGDIVVVTVSGYVVPPGSPSLAP